MGYWYQKNLRFLQTVLREIDIKDYDAQNVVDYMKKAKANCLVVNAGGVIDFFESPLAMANMNRFANNQDILSDIVPKIHEAGMKVIVRVDFRGVEKRRYDNQPDWFGLNKDGTPRVHTYCNPLIYAPCYNSPYTSTHAADFIRHLMGTYKIDGIWENSVGFDNEICYCKNCRTKYLKDTGCELPDEPDAEYRRWKSVQADIHLEHLRAVVKEFGEDKAFCAEIFDMYQSGFSLTTGISHNNARKSFDFIVSCVFLNSGRKPFAPYDIISNSAATIRLSRALDPDKQPVIVTGGNGTRWRYTANPYLEERMWMWQIASCGGGIWNCYFNGQNPSRTLDRRNAWAEKDVYTYLSENSGKISETVPVADVAVYYSNATRDKFSDHDPAYDEYGIFLRGAERVLLEHHIQYGFVIDTDLCQERLNQERLKNVKALLIPNGAVMSDEAMAVIREYVENGGGLVASYNTSLYDETGKQRSDYGLSDVFGISYTGITKNTMDDSYQLITDKNSPLLNGVGDTDLLINGGKTLLCRKTNDSYNTVSTYIPTIPNQPPEYAWIEDMETDFPVIVTGTYGKGKVVFFTNQLEALCFNNGHEDYTEVYKNAIDYAVGGSYGMETNAPRSVHVNAIMDKAGNLTIALINCTGTSQRPLKEVVPIYDIAIKVPLKTRKLSGSEILWGEGDVSVSGEFAEIRVKKLNEFASFHLAFALM